MFSTVIMVCAFMPLFTMAGPEGQIFGPMADTYAFALGGALLLAMTLSPVLCTAAAAAQAGAGQFPRARAASAATCGNCERCLRHRWLTVAVLSRR